MIKKIVTSSIAGVVLFGSVAFAQSPASVPLNVSGSAVRVGTGNSACVQRAVAKRNAAVKATRSAYQKTLANARSVRQTALQAAKQLTNRPARQAARKAAENTFRSAVKAARDAFRGARKTAQERFKAERNACRAARSRR